MLQIPDTREAKFALALELSGRPDLLPPIYIISHKRSSTIPTLHNVPVLRQLATVVVAEEELPEYRAALPGVRLVPIMAGYRGYPSGVGRARQFVLDTASILGQDHILLLDDDLKSLTMLYPNDRGGASHAFRGHIDREPMLLGSLILISLCAEEAYRARPKAVIGSAQCNNANRTLDSSRLRWETNRGGPPAQIQSWRVDRFFEMCGGELDLARFNYHGDDIGLSCQVVSSGAEIVRIPSMIGHYLDYETASVIRTQETAPALRQAEHDALMTLPLAPYIRTKVDVLDRPQWHSLDWKAIERAGLSEPSEHRLWTDPVTV